MPVIRTNNGYASTGGLIGCADRRASMLGAFAAWLKSRGVGRIVWGRSVRLTNKMWLCILVGLDVNLWGTHRRGCPVMRRSDMFHCCAMVARTTATVV